jgi:beta-phosphoglucomutase-like phosphatase (HAD superfamily)
MPKTTNNGIDFEVKGAIFDVDDTLLDNKPGKPGEGLHERARLEAVHEVGNRYGIEALSKLSAEDNLRAFMTAPVHTMESAVWNIFLMTGQADSSVINMDNVLLQEIVTRKDELYKDILINEGEEVPGATQFVRALAESGIADKMAIASTAIRRDVEIFLGKMGLLDLFPAHRIKTKELIKHPKPNPEIFNLAFESLSLPEADKPQVCAFEDDPRGIMAARAAGLYVCAIERRHSVESLMSLEVPPHHAFRTYEDLMIWFNLK